MSQRLLEISELYEDVFGFKPKRKMINAIRSMSEETFELFHEGLLETFSYKEKYVEKQNQDFHKTFIKRILEMMVEYGITLKTALVWDAIGFEINLKRNKESLEESAIWYLKQNMISDERMEFYLDIIMERIPDRELVKED